MPGGIILFFSFTMEAMMVSLTGSMTSRGASQSFSDGFQKADRRVKNFLSYMFTGVSLDTREAILRPPEPPIKKIEGNRKLMALVLAMADEREKLATVSESFKRTVESRAYQVAISDDILKSDVAAFPGGEALVAPYQNRNIYHGERAALRSWLADANLLRACTRITVVKELLDKLRKSNIPDDQLAQEARKMFGSKEVQSLSALNLNSIGLTEIPPELGQLRNLENLELNNNRIRVLIPELALLQNLRYLDLSQNRIRVLRPELGQLKKLESLSLNNNEIVALIPELGQLQSLERLRIRNNRIQVIIPAIGQLQNLRQLELDNNHIVAFALALTRLRSLQILRLNNNRITAFIPQLRRLQNLQELQLNDNRIGALIPEIGQLQKLQRFELRGNGIEVLVPELQQLKDIDTLDLRNNPLREIPEARLLIKDINGGSTPLQQLTQLLQQPAPSEE